MDIRIIKFCPRQHPDMACPVDILSRKYFCSRLAPEPQQGIRDLEMQLDFLLLEGTAERSYPSSGQHLEDHRICPGGLRRFRAGLVERPADQAEQPRQTGPCGQYYDQFAEEVKRDDVFYNVLPAVERVLCRPEQIALYREETNAQLVMGGNAGDKNWNKHAGDLHRMMRWGSFLERRKNGYSWCDIFVNGATSTRSVWSWR